MNPPSTHYGKYIKERTGKNILEKPYGFATYLFEGDYVYIEDIYVDKEARNNTKASHMADEIAEIAKSKGVNKMLGSVCPSTAGATESLKVLLGYGFKLLSSEPNMIYFIKEI